jgi:murein DD-endopeptidase MepM/ murein hydrolase activator NlpD
MKKNFFIIFFALIFVLHTVPIGAASQETRDRLREAERRRSAAGQQVSQQANILAGTQLEMSQVMAEMQALDQQIMDASERLEAVEIDLLATELLFEEAEEDLALAEEEYNLQQEILRERVRTMHEQGSAGLIQVLFQAENIEDFFSRWEYIRTVAQFDRDLLSRLEATGIRIAANRDDLQRSTVLMREFQEQQEIAKQEVEARMAERKEFFILLEEDAERHQQYLDILREEEHALNIELGVIREIERKEIAEAERLRREEEDRRRAEAAAARAQEQSSRLAELNSFEDFAWPLPGYSTISSPFGNRPDPFTGRPTNHEGIDLPAPAGTRINAAEAGYVRFARWGAGWGNYIVIDHADGYSTLYAHQTRNRVTEGQRVTRGQHIGDVGTTGRSTGNHLHFEIRLNGVHLNPMSFFGG